MSDEKKPATEAQIAALEKARAVRAANRETENTQTQEFRSIADFPGVDSPDVVKDLSHESQCVVTNPHPELVYRFVRKVEGRSRVPIAKERGWRDNPPGYNKDTCQMEPVRVRGYTPDLECMAMSKDLYHARMGNKAKAGAQRMDRLAASMAKKPGDVEGVHPTGGDLRITKET